METMLHELGHAVYSSHIDENLPWLLRTDAHTLTTEGYAMMMGRLTKNVDWMQAMELVEGSQAKEIDEATWQMLRAQELVFSRWTQVMLHFERGMYDDPEQDLNALWWNLKEKYQLLTRPDGRDEPDYAAKIHTVIAPVYYHNYMMGSLFASQVHRAMVTDILGVEADLRASHYSGNRAFGQWMSERIFKPGARYDYDELLERATGNPLNPADFAAEFVQ